MANAVAKTKGVEGSTDVLDDIFENAGDGASFDSSEMQIPFVRILQAMSPQLSKKKPEFIEGASQGDVYNTVTSQYWDGEEGIVVIPCYQTTSIWSLFHANKAVDSKERSLQTIQFLQKLREKDRRRYFQAATNWSSQTNTTAW